MVLHNASTCLVVLLWSLCDLLSCTFIHSCNVTPLQTEPDANEGQLSVERAKRICNANLAGLLDQHHPDLVTSIRLFACDNRDWSPTGMTQHLRQEVRVRRY